MMGLITLPAFPTYGSADGTVSEDSSNPVGHSVQGDSPDRMAKSDLFAAHTQTGELYNMIGEQEDMEDWAKSNIQQAADLISAVYNEIKYQKAKPASVGNGMGSPSTEPIKNGMKESAPVGWEKTVKSMKKHKNIDNPFALAN
jgi:hypothetical protein